MSEEEDRTRRPVLVIWDDSTQPVSRWRWVEDIEPEQPVRCYTVGFILHDTPDALTLAMSIGRDDGENEQASGVTTIPKSCIRSRIGFNTPPRNLP